MALSSTTTPCMPHSKLLTTLAKPTTLVNVPSSLSLSSFFKYDTNKHVTLTRKPSYDHKFVARSSGDGGSETTATATTAETEEGWEGGEGGESSAVEVNKGPPSLISALNVEKALRGIAITDVDHYARLGLRRGCSYDQVGAAYENKVKELSSQGLEDEESSKELDLLKESYSILSSEEERRLYDWSLSRTVAPDRYMWPFEADITQAPKGTPPPREPEDVGPTVAVGYFILSWLVLAFALSIALNVI